MKHVPGAQQDPCMRPQRLPCWYLDPLSRAFLGKTCLYAYIYICIYTYIYIYRKHNYRCLCGVIVGVVKKWTLLYFCGFGLTV